MKTSELTGVALDWAVAKCEVADVWIGFNHVMSGKCLYVSGPDEKECYTPSTGWSQGGPIIERECIFIAPTWDGEVAGSSARASRTAWIEGPTPLIAAMRCYVASKLGDNVDIPPELI